ncbi:unnamed protein product [Orchesella dallaii]|uniref:Transcobalamin-2 n=1 Tax=Orchesella dallaii TaxID=48710 RepID=A0ABP1QZ97_9HEXA
MTTKTVPEEKSDEEVAVSMEAHNILCENTMEGTSKTGGAKSSRNKSTESDTLSADNLQYKLENIRNLALEWLQTKRTDEYGWPSGDTARIVIALASAVKDWPTKNDLEARLIVKQLEIELLEKLLSKDTVPISPAEVCYFALALSASCRDPHNFHGHNLIVSLEKHHEDVDYQGYPAAFGYAFTSLVSCMSGAHTHKHQARRLLQIARDDSSSTRMYSVDTRATALIALECIRNRKTSDFLSRHIIGPMHAISKLQLEDGTFGNLHTTALTIQALSGLHGAEINWNKSATVHALESLQEPNGSFLDSPKETADAVIAISALLNGMGILGARKGHCKSARLSKHRSGALAEDGLVMYNNDEDIPFHTNTNEVRPKTSEGEHKDDESPKLVHLDSSDQVKVSLNGIENELLNGKNSSDHDVDMKQDKYNSLDKLKNPNHDVNVTYWLWIGPDPVSADKHNMTVRIEANATFYAVMQKAASLNHKFM